MIKPGELRDFFVEIAADERKKDGPSHKCSKCGDGISIYTGKRYQWQNGKKHLLSKHAKVMKDLALEKFSANKVQLQEMTPREEERQALLAARSGLAVSRMSVKITDLLKDDVAERCPPLFNMQMPLSSGEQTRLRMAYAIWAAKDGLPLNAFEKDGFKLFCEIVGLAGGPCGETVREYQALLATEILSSMKVRLAAISDSSPLPLISLQTDVRTSHDGAQQMGIRVTACNPLTLGMENIFLPLETADGGSLDTQTEARLVDDALKKLSLHPWNIYSQTTDSASVALAGARRNNILTVPCYAHQTALVLKDCLVVKLDSREMDLETTIQISDISAVEKHLIGVAARASHFNRCPLAQRLLEAWQIEKNLNPIRFISWSPTRWTGIYEAVLRDFRVLEDTQAFVVEYVNGEKFSKAARDKLLPDESTVEFGRVFVSILHPLHSLTLKLQEDDISLAKALPEICETWLQLKTTATAELDKYGKVTEKTLHPSLLNSSFVSFRSKLANSLKSRLLDKVDDETLISVLLDPEVYTVFAVCATERGEFDDETVTFAETILGRIDRLSYDVVGRLLEVFRAKSQSDLQTKSDVDNESTVETSSHLSHLGKPASINGDRSPKKTSSADFHGSVSILAKVKRLRKSREQPAKSTTNSEALINEAIKELTRYHEKRRLICDDDDLVAMRFWAKHATEFPNLYHLFVANRGARPATARLESCFSTVGLAVPPQRASIKIATLNHTITVKNAKIHPIDVLHWAANKT